MLDTPRASAGAAEVALSEKSRALPDCVVNDSREQVRRLVPRMLTPVILGHAIYEAGTAYGSQPYFRSNYHAVDRSLALKIRYS